MDRNAFKNDIGQVIGNHFNGSNTEALTEEIVNTVEQRMSSNGSSTGSGGSNDAPMMNSGSGFNGSNAGNSERHSWEGGTTNGGDTSLGRSH